VFEELEDSTSGMEPDGVALNMLAFVLVRYVAIKLIRHGVESKALSR
jgi:hypothetical protein